MDGLKLARSLIGLGLGCYVAGPGPASDPDMRALAGTRIVWQGLQYDNDLFLQLGIGKKFATLQAYEGPGPQDRQDDNIPYIIFGAVEGAYLALETLVTHDVLLSICTQAVGLSALYIIERLKWLSSDKQRSSRAAKQSG